MDEAMDLLAGYLVSLKAEPVVVISILALLQQEEAIMEMLNYIAETRESSLVKLLSTASQISRKYPPEYLTDENTDNEDAD